MKKVVTFGEIMLLLSPPGYLRFGQARSFDVIYGGGEANVAVSLANFGVPVDYVTRLPNNDLGQACIQFLHQYGVGVNKIVRGGDRRPPPLLGRDSRRLPGGDPGGQRDGPDRILRPELP